jgi:hypothetical protein
MHHQSTLAVESKLRGANSVEKKSLISMLKTTKKVNVITVPAKNEGGTSRKITVKKAVMKKAVY